MPTNSYNLLLQFNRITDLETEMQVEMIVGE